VHDCDNEDVVGLNGVKHGVWEDVNQAPPHVLLENPPTRRSLGNLRKRHIDTRDEPKLKTDLATGVETRRALIL